MSDTIGQLSDALAAVLTDRLGAGVRIKGLKRLTGGASRETWAFDTVDAHGNVRALILRRDFPGAGRPSLGALIGVDDDFARRDEFALFQALFDAGLPVPRPLALPEGTAGLTDCFVMERIDGESLPQRLVRDEAYVEARALLPEQLGTVLARIHALDPTDLPQVPEHDTAHQIDIVRRMAALGPAPRPVFEVALRWLEDKRPKEQPRRLVHGDFRNGNFVVGPEGLRAVLDWEYAHIGDPMEDLAFLCLKPWRFGNVTAEVGGFGPRSAVYRAYERAGGTPVDPEAMRFWEVLCNLKWGALCVARAMAHLLGMQRSGEAAVIGRRVAETEHDILALELMVDRALSRTAFGSTLAEKSIIRHHIAESRMDIEQARLLTLKAAFMMDTVGNKAARSEIAQIKVIAPNMALRVLDRAIQVHGAAGLSQDLPLAGIFAGMRALRMGDGPDEVHREAIAKLEIQRRLDARRP